MKSIVERILNALDVLVPGGIILGVGIVFKVLGFTALGVIETIRAGREDSLNKILSILDEDKFNNHVLWGLEVGAVATAIYLLSFPTSTSSWWVRVLCIIPGMLLWAWLSAKGRWLSARSVCVITFLTTWAVVRFFRLPRMAAATIFAVFVFFSGWDLVIGSEKTMETKVQQAIGRFERISRPSAGKKE